VSVNMTGLPLGQPEPWPWQRALGRSFLIAVLASGIGGVIVQAYVWPMPRHVPPDEQHLLVDSATAVALVAGALDFFFSFLSWSMRRTAGERVTARQLPGRP
jgi:hypothetical protein